MVEVAGIQVLDHETLSPAKTAFAPKSILPATR
jgi:hypothetical protein